MRLRSLTVHWTNVGAFLRKSQKSALGGEQSEVCRFAQKRSKASSVSSVLSWRHRAQKGMGQGVVCSYKTSCLHVWPQAICAWLCSLADVVCVGWGGGPGGWGGGRGGGHPAVSDSSERRSARPAASHAMPSLTAPAWSPATAPCAAAAYPATGCPALCVLPAAAGGPQIPPAAVGGGHAGRPPPACLLAQVGRLLAGRHGH